MFDYIATAQCEAPRASLESPHVAYDMQRYCPVELPRGRRTQYHLKPNFSPVLVANSSVLHSTYFNNTPISFDWPALLRRYDDPVSVENVVHEEPKPEITPELLEYISDAVPEFTSEHLDKARAFHNVTEMELPTSSHEEGMTVTWDDHLVPHDHPARVYCGEGPFMVARDENYLIAFLQDVKNKTRISGVRAGSNRVVLESLSDHRTVIAHGGFFKKVSVEAIEAPEHTKDDSVDFGEMLERAEELAEVA